MSEQFPTTSTSTSERQNSEPEPIFTDPEVAAVVARMNKYSEEEVHDIQKMYDAASPENKEYFRLQLEKAEAYDRGYTASFKKAHDDILNNREKILSKARAEVEAIYAEAGEQVDTEFMEKSAQERLDRFVGEKLSEAHSNGHTTLY